MMTLKQQWRALCQKWGWFVNGKPEEVHPTAKTRPAAKEKTCPAAEMAQKLEAFLRGAYDFRYNLLTDETEFRPAGAAGTPFTPVSQRALNSLCMDAHTRGIACWDRDLNRYIYSTRIVGYHPFRLFMDELPAWDGVDRLETLARRVSDERLWICSFHTWMLGLTAQWMGITDLHANSVAPILVSSEQGRRKSTFCKALMPAFLQRYYLDDVKLTAQGQVDRLLAEMGLLNLDEFDKYAATKMPFLKNLMQMATLNLRKAYQKNYCALPRIASFIGTSNRRDILTDPSGSRRFICVEVEKCIDCTGINHEQIYAQLKAELMSGVRYWFSKEEEQELQQHNRSFYRQCPAEEVLRVCFRPAAEGEQCLLLSAAEIFKALKEHNAAAMRGANPAQFSQVLLAAGMERKHTKWGNVYRVVAVP